ncbi:MAG: ABC transporter permease [Algisphaera sp.]
MLYNAHPPRDLPVALPPYPKPTSVPTSVPPQPVNTVETVIEPVRGWGLPDFRAVFQSSELWWALAWRDLRVRYRQTVLGLAWTVLTPFISMVVFSVIFGSLLQVPTDGHPYPVMLFSGLLVWRLFENVLHAACQSLIVNQNLIGKLYFPRLLLPLTPILTFLVNYCVGLIILAGLMVWFQMMPTWRLLTLPLWVGLAILAALSIGLWCAALNAIMRDIQHAIPFITGLMLFVTPVMYTQKSITARFPQALLAVYELNPMVAIIDGARWAVLPGWAPPNGMAVVSLSIMFVVLVGGLVFFTRAEQNVVDVV